MLPKKISSILIFFDAFGYNSGFSQLLLVHPKITAVINIIHILLAIFFTIFKVVLVAFFLRSMKMLEVINSSLQYSAMIYTYWIIILDANLHQSDHRHFYEMFSKINKFYMRQENICLGHYLVKIFICLSFSILFMMLINFTEYTNYFQILYTVLMKICEIRICYYMFCLQIVQFQLKSIDKMILNIGIDFNRLKMIREYQYCVYEMTNFLNSSFGWSQVATVLYCFYSFLTYLNWLYVCINYGQCSAIVIMSKNKLFL